MPRIRFQFDPEKAAAAAGYLASKQLSELTKGKICKLLFLADRLHFVRHGRPITGDTFSALEHGPILSNTLDALNSLINGNPNQTGTLMSRCVSLDLRFDNPRFVANGVLDLDAFSRSDLRVLDEVVQHYGGNSFAELRNLTHEFASWSNAWNSRGDADSAEICFDDLFESEDPDAVAGAREEITENAIIHEALACLR